MRTGNRRKGGIFIASTNQTPRLGLNDWTGADAPLREDFCRDNRLVDEALGGHLADQERHLSAEERARLQTPFLLGSYVGTGADPYAVHVGFRPRLGLLFSVDLYLCQFEQDLGYTGHAMGFLSARGDSMGVHTTDDGFTVDYVEDNAMMASMPVFNRRGVTYVYVLWK